FRQGTEPSRRTIVDLKTGLVQDYVSEMERRTGGSEKHPSRCDGEIINGRCYVFNPMPMPFLEAQDSCKSHNPSAELASVTNEDLQSRLVSMVTNGGQRDPVVTWLGEPAASWLDGSEWRMEATWWTAADCDLKRASFAPIPS
uniref:C-type lectin domain-containing protein n=1 Tax=Neogobius melanostomus TaxID=47308 RepID=A0A8C6WEQ5_9GOBI